MILKNLITKTANIVTQNVFNFNTVANMSSKSCLIAFQTKLNLLNVSSNKNIVVNNYLPKNQFSTSTTNFDLMEFFESKQNMSEDTIKHGRPWHMEELRIKSNTDLHQLWYILHKERNMLLTMEEAYKVQGEAMPSPERITKVDESMENILAVVEERNIAYNMLETGESKQIISYRRYNSFGHIQKYKPREYLVPWYMNKSWKLKYHYKKLPYWSKHYRSLFRVNLNRERAKIVRRVKYAQNVLSRKHNDIDNEFVQKHFEKKYGFNPPLPYDELIRKPKPDDLPAHITHRQKFKNNEEF